MRLCELVGEDRKDCEKTYWGVVVFLVLVKAQLISTIVGCTSIKKPDILR